MASRFLALLGYNFTSLVGNETMSLERIETLQTALLNGTLLVHPRVVNAPLPVTEPFCLQTPTWTLSAS